MVTTLRSRTVSKVAIVGSGQVGPDVALHMAQALLPYGVSVVVVDISDDALAAGREKFERKIDRAMESGAVPPACARAMKDSTLFANTYESVLGADLIVEAAAEDLATKHGIFRRLEELVTRNAILASNSSHLEPEAIFAECAHKGRCIVTHYFFPAERNPMVEIVPGAATDEAVTCWLLKFYEAIGKVPIRVGSRYGYAMGPIFLGLFHAACLCVEEGLGTVKQVDDVVRRTLDQGVGPFTAMNLTGGNRTAFVGLQHYHREIFPWYHPSRLLEEQMESGQPWDGARRDEPVEVPDDQEERIAARILGAYFGVVGETLDAGITSVADVELGVETALVMAPPCARMNELGVDRALNLVRRYAADHGDFPVPRSLEDQAARKQPWRIPVVLRDDEDGIAVLTIRRPAASNALNKEVLDQIGEHIDAIASDDAIRGAVLTGSGNRAFVDGADLDTLAAARTPADRVAASRRSHAVLNRIEGCGKPVVCAYNGLALGGGHELALACHARIAKKGLELLAGQPEPQFGLMAGAGGTQRLPRIIGFRKAWELMRTGRPISGREAKALGLVLDEIEGDLVMAAIALARDMARSGYPRIRREPLEPPSDLPDVDLGHLSRAVDAVLCKAILEGARLGLDQGLELETECVGEVGGLEDSRIGMENLLRHGPRAKAEFLHR
jgi:enoyl-CoA hydratase/3-hydroxyacyl-CoA dehydrogenase